MYFFNFGFFLIASYGSKSLSRIPMCSTCRCCVWKPIPFSWRGCCTTGLQPPAAIPSPSRPLAHAGVQAGTGYPSAVAHNCLAIVGVLGGTSFTSSFVSYILKSDTPTNNPSYLLVPLERGVVCPRAEVA